MTGTNQDSPAKPSVAPLCAGVFAVIGFLVVRSFPREQQGSGQDWGHILLAAIAGGLSAMVGMGLGKLIDKLRG